jgi:hypothetical protein
MVSLQRTSLLKWNKPRGHLVIFQCLIETIKNSNQSIVSGEIALRGVELKKLKYYFLLARKYLFYH